MNVFLLDFHNRLREWNTLRNNLAEKDIENICIDTDAFWQQCPMKNHYLHPDDVKNWPGPWELLNDNVYCYYARALGMLYTLLLLGVETVDLVEVKYYNEDNLVLLLVDNAKYVMNYWPNSVLNTDLSNIVITKHINIDPIKIKIGNL